MNEPARPAPDSGGGRRPGDSTKEMLMKKVLWSGALALAVAALVALVPAPVQAQAKLEGIRWAIRAPISTRRPMPFSGGTVGFVDPLYHH